MPHQSVVESHSGVVFDHFGHFSQPQATSQPGESAQRGPKRGPASRDRTRQSGSKHSASRRSRRNAFHTQEYWPYAEVDNALQSGEVFSSVIRFNQHDASQAFVTVKGLPLDICVQGAQAHNRTLEGDRVAVRLLPESHWLRSTDQAQQSSQCTPEGCTPPLSQLSTSAPPPALATPGCRHCSPASCDSLQSAFEAKLSQYSLCPSHSAVSPALLSTPSHSTCDILAATTTADDVPEEELPPAHASAVAWLAGRIFRSGKRPTGEVVALLSPSRRRAAVVGFLTCPPPGNQLQLQPCDPRLPRLLLQASELRGCQKASGAQSFKQLQRVMFMAAITEWRAGAEHPEGRVVSLLGRAGTLKAESEAILAVEGIRNEAFSEEVSGCLPSDGWEITAGEAACRRDLRSHRIFTIDPASARDLDDALSVEPLAGRGGYRVGVHIADVSHFIPPDSALDEEARLRGTSVYMVEGVVPMLPRRLCEELCSLNAGVDRLAFSIIWDLDREGRVLSRWIGRTVIRSCAKLAYDHAQAVITDTLEDGNQGGHAASDEPDPAPHVNMQALTINGPAANGSQLPRPHVHGPHTWNQVAADIRLLHCLAGSMREARFGNGALRLDNLKFRFALDARGEPVTALPEVRREANSLVEEFMLLANMTAAQAISEAFPKAAFRRRHPRPHPPQRLRDLERLGQELGLPIDASSAGALQASLTGLGARGVDAATIATITMLATKPMQPAVYFCTGDEDVDVSDMGHYALAVPMYTHFTSPIRRYADVVVHRLLAAALAASVPPDGAAAAGADCDADADADAPAISCPYSTDDVVKLATSCTTCKASADAAQDASQRLHLAMILRGSPIIAQAVITSIKGPRFFDVFVLELGCEARVNVPDITPRPIDAAWNKVTRTLSLSAFNDPARTPPLNGRTNGDAVWIAAPHLHIPNPSPLGKGTNFISGPSPGCPGSRRLSTSSQPLSNGLQDARARVPDSDEHGWPRLSSNKHARNPLGLPPLRLPAQLQQFSRLPVLVTGQGSAPGKLPKIEVHVCVQH